MPGMPDMTAAQMQQFQQMMTSGGAGPFGSLGGMGIMAGESQPDPKADAEVKDWTTVYPIYLDAKRCFKKGCRRVPYAKSVLFPQSQHIAAAVKSLGLEARHQPHKSHPQDWANPGRVKVRLTNADGKPIKPAFPDKQALLLALASHLQARHGGVPPPLPARNSVPSVKHARSGRVAPPLDPLRARLRLIKYPPPAQRLPPNSPALEAGLLNSDMGGLGSLMGGAMSGMGPLGAMMGSMGLGDDDEDEAQDETKEEEKEKESEKKVFMPGKRQRKKVVRMQR